MSIREAVFVNEQCVPRENELDDDDARSFHWVVYASVSQSIPAGEGGRRSSEGGKLPVGTIRLVPPPHEAHPQPEPEHEGTGGGGGGGGGGGEGVPDDKHAVDQAKTAPTHPPATQEPYIKLTRLATLQAYRRLGLGRLLVNTALGWASTHPEIILPPPDPTAREARNLASSLSSGSVEDGVGGAMWEGGWNGLVLAHAQEGVQKWWEGQGFVRDGGLGRWVEEGIWHVGMWRRVDVKKI